MSAERKLGNLIPGFVNRLIRRAPQPETPLTKYPKAPNGTNAFFMALDGTHFQGDWQHYGQLGSYCFGPREVISVQREKFDCEGGVCVEVFYGTVDKF